MKRFGVALALAIVFGGFAARGAEAGSFTVVFCPGDPDGTCSPNGITAASITVTTDDSTGDPNDYFVTASITGTLSNHLIDEIGITISSASTPGDYEARPTVTNTTGAAAGTTWTVYWDGVSGDTSSCTSDTFQGNTFCANGTTNVSSVGTSTWTFYVDLQPGESIAPGDLNLRANFVDSTGKTVGNLSPGSAAVTGSSTGIVTGSSTGLVTTAVPEPTTLALLGSGLLVAARKLRRRKTNNPTA